MAGDWLQIDLDLPEKPEVLAIARASALCPQNGANLSAVRAVDVVVVRMFHFWRWVERHASSELVRGTDVQDIATLCGGDELFWRAVETQGWVRFTEDGVVIPGWKKRFSKSAKKRMLDAKRKKQRRKSGEKASAKRPQNVACEATNVESEATKLGPKEEKRREENTKGVNPLKPPGVDVVDLTIPASLDTPEVREALGDWIRYKRQRGQPYKSPKFLSDFLGGFIADGPGGLVDAIRWSLGQNYQGIFRSSEKANARQPSRTGPGQRFSPEAGLGSV